MGAMRQRLVAAVGSMSRWGLRKLTHMTPDFSLASCKRRLVVRSSLVISPTTHASDVCRKPSSITAKTSASVRAVAMSRREGGNPNPANPGA